MTESEPCSPCRLRRMSVSHCCSSPARPRCHTRVNASNPSRSLSGMTLHRLGGYPTSPWFGPRYRVQTNRLLQTCGGACDMINSSLTLPASGVHALAAMVVVDDGEAG